MLSSLMKQCKLEAMCREQSDSACHAHTDAWAPACKLQQHAESVAPRQAAHLKAGTCSWGMSFSSMVAYWDLAPPFLATALDFLPENLVGSPLTAPLACAACIGGAVGSGPFSAASACTQCASAAAALGVRVVGGAELPCDTWCERVQGDTGAGYRALTSLAATSGSRLPCSSSSSFRRFAQACMAAHGLHWL